MHQPEMQCEEARGEIIWRSIGGDHHIRRSTRPPQPRHSPGQCRHVAALYDSATRAFIPLQLPL